MSRDEYQRGDKATRDTEAALASAEAERDRYKAALEVAAEQFGRIADITIDEMVMARAVDGEEAALAALGLEAERLNQ